MGSFSLSGLIKFFLGLLIVQAATGALVYAALKTDQFELWMVFAVLGATLTLLTAFWFGSIVHHARQDAVVKLKEDFSRQREKIRLQAEREKAKVVERSHKQLIRDRGRTEAKANAKVGASFAGVMGLGLLMLFTQFVTIGMLMMTTAGGALAGYAFRSRQEYLVRKGGQSAAEGVKRVGRAGGQAALNAVKQAGTRLLSRSKPANPT